MIENQVLNYILTNKDIDFLERFGDKYYTAQKPVYQFLHEHYLRYRTVPDYETVLGKFSDFKKFAVGESKDYLCTELHRAFVAKTLQDKIFDKNAPVHKLTDALQAQEEMVKIFQDLAMPATSYGTDIIHDASLRYESLLDRQANPDAYFFPTGFDELDMIFGGGMKRIEEFIALYARTNNAKTWIAEKIAVAVWATGANVGFFSPEMTAESIGYRFDTLYKHFQNSMIQGFDTSYDTTNYNKYIKSLEKQKNIFSVTSPRNFNKNTTVSAIRQWVLDLKLDMIVIDGLSYMKNERAHGWRQKDNEKLTDLCEDLIQLSNELSIPIIAVLQANRTAARDKNGEVTNAAPDLDTIFGSDGIAHNVTRAIALSKSKDNVLSMFIAKNRYGQAGQRLYYQTNIDIGEFTYLPNPKDGIAVDNSEKEREKFQNEEENF